MLESYIHANFDKYTSYTRAYVALTLPHTARKQTHTFFFISIDLPKTQQIQENWCRSVSLEIAQAARANDCRVVQSHLLATLDVWQKSTKLWMMAKKKDHSSSSESNCFSPSIVVSPFLLEGRGGVAVHAFSSLARKDSPRTVVSASVKAAELSTAKTDRHYVCHCS